MRPRRVCYLSTLPNARASWTRRCAQNHECQHHDFIFIRFVYDSGTTRWSFAITSSLSFTYFLLSPLPFLPSLGIGTSSHTNRRFWYDCRR